MRIPVPTALAVAIAAVLAEPAASLTIDNFEESGFTVIDVQGGTGEVQEQSGISGTNVAGGVRLVTSQAPIAGVHTATAVLLPTVADDSVALSEVGLADGTTSNFVFVYDGIADGTADGSGGNLNLDLTGLTSIDVTATAVNVVADVQLTLWSSNTSRLRVLPLVNGVTSFSLANLAGFNLADVQAIRVSLIGFDPLESATITSIEAVPEPASGLLVAAGLLGLALRRRRAH
jgi:hypothetical protein